MDIKISKPIYIRKGPGISYDIIGVANPSGQSIGMDGMVQGEVLKGMSNWYFKINDNNEKQYYWEGGTIKNESQLINAQQYIDNRFDGQNLVNTIDYNLLLNTDDGLKQTMGDGITVAIIDSPISKNIEFRNQVKRPFDIDHPADSHGTFIAGIIAGNTNILGIARNTQILELPIRDKFGNLIDDGINFLQTNTDPMVVNVSQKLEDRFLSIFQNATNKIIVASAGRDSELQAANLFLPASLSNVIAVGCVSESFQAPGTMFNPKLDFLVPDFKYASYSKDQNISIADNGDSYACAVVSSFITLLLSMGTLKFGMTLDEIKSKINQLTSSFKEKSSFDFLNIINPKA